MTDTSSAVTTIAPKPPIVVLRERLESRHSELAHALPSDIPPERFIRAVTTAAQLDANLQACSFSSLWLACLKACRDGLLPDGREGAIVPFKSQAQWIPMVYGLIKRFRQSGECRWITANVIREGESFEHYVDETGEHFKHVPDHRVHAPPVVKVYAAAMTRDGAFNVVVLTMDEINKIRNESRATREDSPWRKWPDEMMKKTALRRLSKMLPAGREITDEDSPLPMVTDGPALMPAPPIPMPEQRRPRDAADALNEFARPNAAASPGGPTPDYSPPAEQQTGGGVEESGNGAAHSVPDDDHAAVSDEGPLTPHGEELVEAYERGKQAKADGFTRKALPPEYRDDEHSRHTMAWQSGFDGKPMPEWS